MIKFSKANIDKTILKNVSQILRSGWLTHGKFTEKFEKEMIKYTGAKHCTLVSSCTAALHLSCLALKLKKGDEVIVPAMTHTATSHAVEYTGAKPIFADINFETGNIDISSIKRLINKKTKAIVVVHMAGRLCLMNKLKKILKNKKIHIIEDCAHGLGTTDSHKHSGNFGVAGCFSFYPTKQITTGEGGAIITNNSKFYKKVKILKAFGIDKDITERKKPGEYDVKSLGFNYRMTDFQAAMGFLQLKKYSINLRRRQYIAKKYIGLLRNNKNLILPRFSKNDSYFVFQILLKNKKLKDELMQNFKKNKVGISVHYGRALPEMNYYKKKYNLPIKNFINSKKYAEKVISLPVYPKLSDKNIKYICSLINSLS
tara:strand:+ start:2611 stop:3723 length:1113 start_codon:yes stop_codon:yes gene_type:complete